MALTSSKPGKIYPNPSQRRLAYRLRKKFAPKQKKMAVEELPVESSKPMAEEEKWVLAFEKMCAFFVDIGRNNLFDTLGLRKDLWEKAKRESA